MFSFKLVILVVRDVVAEVDQQLRQAPLRRRVISENGREGCVAQRFRQTLAQGLPGTVIVAESVTHESAFSRQEIRRSEKVDSPQEASDHMFQQTHGVGLH